MDACFSFWNGGLHRGDGRMVHYCSSMGCQSRAVTRVKAQETLLWLVNGKPFTPVMSRWTKVGPCVDFWLRGQVACAFRGLLQLATEALRFNDAPAEDGCDFDGSNYTDIAAVPKEDFLVAAGRRLERTQQLLNQPKHRVRLAILAVVMASLRRLHVYFFG